MRFVVKNTTNFNPLDLLCPHSCRGCECLGTVLCERCKNYIIQQHFDLCPICKQRLSRANSATIKNQLPHYPNCDSPFIGTFIVGYRTGALAKLIKDFKYQAVHAAGPILLDLLDATIPKNLEELLLNFTTNTVKPPEIVIVPLPTIGKHIRTRGLDHTKILAKRLARRRNWQYSSLLGRAKDTVQVGTKAADRQAQAKSAYFLKAELDPDAYYILLDDIWTTGSTMLAAAQLFRDAGAKNLLAAVIATGEPQKSNNDEKSIN